MISVIRLTKRYGFRNVLLNLDLSVQEGEFVALLGPNGAGKTTLLRILATLARPNSGLVRINGYALPAQSTQARSVLGVVSHQPLLYGDLTAQENLEFYSRMYSIPQATARINHVLKFAGLENRSGDLVRTFSRGMQQRLSIGRAILHDPSVLLLDEPYTGLDQDACEMLDNLLREVASQGKTILLTSHDLTRIQSLATRFDVLSRGRIVASIRSADLQADGLLGFYRQALEQR